MRLLDLLFLTIISGGERPAKAFTSASDGAWNDTATWTDGTDYPRLAGDTVTIAQGHEVTIPSGHTVEVGAITMNAGLFANRTKIINNGTWNLGGEVTLNAYCSLEANGAFIIDLKGYDISPSSSITEYTFTGTSGSRGTVRSTGGRGNFNSPGNQRLVATMDYVDFSGFGDSVLGRSHTSAHTQHYEYCTFSDYDSLKLDETSTNVNAGFEINYCDFRGTRTQYDELLHITMGDQALGTAPREITNCTFDGQGTLARIRFNNCKSITFTDNVIKDMQNYNDFQGGSFASVARNMHYTTIDIADQFQYPAYGDYLTAATELYVYYDSDNHPFAAFHPAVVGSFDVSDSVFEGTGLGTNWLLHTSTAAHSIAVDNVIMLGPGNLVAFTSNCSPTVSVTGCTFYGTNDDGEFGRALLTEQSCTTLGGTVTVKDNLFVDSNTDGGGTEAAISLLGTAASQVDTADYNGHAGYDSGGSYSAVTFAYLEDAYGTPSAIAGLGTNDVGADPLFSDKTRNLADWDDSLGGNGTAANAISEMLKKNGYGGTFNTNYTVTALLAYVFAGFTPTGAGATAFDGTGSGSSDIGARP